MELREKSMPHQKLSFTRLYVYNTTSGVKLNMSQHHGIMGFIGCLTQAASHAFSQHKPQQIQKYLSDSLVPEDNNILQQTLLRFREFTGSCHDATCYAASSLARIESPQRFANSRGTSAGIDSQNHANTLCSLNLFKKPPSALWRLGKVQ